ncbi:ADP-ribosyltransferase-containing protein [Vogesella indigofera]|uniref:ADP-ribosyltransferase-containing protein n=1 Tax=Vogesella indigofera TaxID=45465 RepID=UPI00234DE72C|nr:LPD38 domain-containing protein [Vogesella indigofera]MDC7704060.1 transglycosylase SLT domain-containing protein [Vogesella indigofera]
MLYEQQHGQIQYNTDGLQPSPAAPELATPMAPAVKAGQAPSIPGSFMPIIREASAATGVHPAILSGLLAQESGFRADVISGKTRSSAGALGIAQFMPDTAREYGINPLDPAQAIHGAARYLSKMLTRFGGDYHKAVAAYNAGPGGNFANPETAAYVPAVQQYARQYAGLFADKEDHDKRGHDVGNLRRLDNAHRQAAQPTTVQAKRAAQIKQEDAAIRQYDENGGGLLVSVGRGFAGLGLLGAVAGNKLGLVDDGTVISMADNYSLAADPRASRLGRRIEEADGIADTVAAAFSDPTALLNMAAEQVPGLAVGGPMSAPARVALTKAGTTLAARKLMEQAAKRKATQLALKAGGRLATGGAIAAGTTFAQGGGANVANALAEQQAQIDNGKRDRLDLDAAIDKGLIKAGAEAGTAAVLGTFLPHAVGKRVAPKLVSAAAIGSASELAETVAGAAAVDEELRKSELVLAGIMGAPFGVAEGAQAMRAANMQVNDTQNQAVAAGQAPVTPVHQPQTADVDPLKAAMRDVANEVHGSDKPLPAVIAPQKQAAGSKPDQETPITEPRAQRVFTVDAAGNATPEIQIGPRLAGALPAPALDVPTIGRDGTIYPNLREAQNASLRAGMEQEQQAAAAVAAAGDSPEALAVHNHPGHTPQAVHDALPEVADSMRSMARALPLPDTHRTGGDAIDIERDDLLTALAKLGGIRGAEVQSQLGEAVTDDNHTINRRGLVGKPVIRREGGMPLDEAAQRLADYGYLSVNEHGQADTADLQDVLLDYETPRYTPAGQQLRAQAASVALERQRLTDPANVYQRATELADRPLPALTKEVQGRSRLSLDDDGKAIPGFDGNDGRKMAESEPVPFSKATESGSQPTAAQAREQLQRMLGKSRLVQLEQAGLTIHDSSDSLPPGLQSLDLHGVQGMYDPQTDRIHIVAANLADPDAARGVLLHEVLHRHADAILNPRVKALLGKRLAAGGKSGEAKDWFDAAREQAQAAGTPENLLLEEIAAYAIEQYINAPRTLPQRVMSAVRDFIAGIRVRLVKAGVSLRLTDVDLTAMVRARLLQERAASDETPTAGTDGTARPTLTEDGKRISATIDGTNNFWSWVDAITGRQADGDVPPLGERQHQAGHPRGREDDLRLVGGELSGGLAAANGETRQNRRGTAGADEGGANGSREVPYGLGRMGRPRVFYHGTRDDITAFDLNHPNRKDHGWLGRGIYLSSAPEIAEAYAQNKAGEQAPNVMPLYAILRNPYRATLADKANLRGQSREEIDSYTDYLVAQGHDGVVMSHNGVEEVVVFDPAQVKSAVGNNGDFDPANPDIRYSRRPVSMREGNFPGTGKADAAPDATADAHVGSRADFDPESRRENLARQHVNRFNRVEKFEQTLAEAGIDIPHWQSTSAAEVAYHGRRAERLADFREGEAAELASVMAANDISPERLDWYLLARHAEERNQHIAQVNPEMPDGGSGLSTAQARSLLAGRTITATVEIENEHGKVTPEPVQVGGFTSDEIAGLDQAAAIIDRMTAMDRDLRVDYGLEDAGKVQQWAQQWQHYVPLAGKAGVAEFGGAPGRQSGFSVRGDQKRAAGRKSIAPNITEQVIRQVEDTISRGEVNRVSSTLVAMAHRLTKSDSMPLAANGKPVIEVNPLDLRQYFRNGTLVRSEMPALSGDDIVVARIDGKDVPVRLHDPALADAVRNLDAPQLGALLDFFAKGTRFISTTFTAANPAFWAVAYLRDMTNVATLGQQHGGGFVRKALWRVLPATWHGLKHEFGGKTSDPEFDAFRRHGGRTGFLQVERNLAAKRNELVAAIRAAGPLSADTAPAKVKLVLMRLWHYYLATGAAFETGVRYAAYLGAREQGKSQAEAAALSKELLTNFNRKGQGQTAAGMAALFPFFNAALQGTRNELGALKDRRVQLALTSFGAMVTMTQLALFASIEEDKLRELLDNPTFQEDRQRNILIPAFGPVKPEDGRPYWRIPLVSPGLMSLVTGTGIAMAETAWGADGAQWRSLGAIGRGMAELAPPPVGDMVKAGTLASEGNGTRAVLVAAAPAGIKPALQVAANINHLGQQLVPGSPYDTITPDAYRARSRTRTSWASDVAIAMNRGTGGNSAQSGYVDISPETILHLVRGYSGGIGGFIMQAGDAMTNPQKDWLDAPIINRFAASPDGLERGRTGMAMDTLNRVSDQVAQLKRLQQNGEDDAADRLASDMDASGDSQLAGDVAWAQRRLARLGREDKALGQRKDEEALQIRRDIEAERRDIYSQIIAAERPSR